MSSTSLPLARSGAVYAERPDLRETAADRWARSCWRALDPVLRRDRLQHGVREALRLAAPTRQLDDATLLARLRQGAHASWHDARQLGPTLAAVRELCRRALGMEPYPSQLLGASGLLTGRLVEMQTGEGKSLTAALGATLAGCAQVPVHVITVNDYLAERDAEEMAPLYQRAGLRVASVLTGMSPEARRAAYACDICYCTGKELVFDYLKDRSAFGSNTSAARHQLGQWLAGGSAQAPLLRGLHCAIVDEADSIFIDEARTPLILAVKQPAEGDGDHYATALRLAARLQADTHFLLDTRRRSVQLTALGRQHVTEATATLGGEWQARLTREHWVLQALRAQHLFLKDQQYVVREGKVEIVDENTGRVLAGRTWEQGLHQMIETKEGVELSDRARTLSRITYQRFFGRYLRLAGMTGTAREVRREIRNTYHLRTLVVAPHRPSRRERWPDLIAPDAASKWQQVASAVQQQLAAQRAVLIGTRTVQDSEVLSEVLTAQGIAHRVLNARQDAEEAAVVRSAGLAGTVTVATNMAGRGTDIKLPPEVLERGGLHVILSEHHESRRVDRQLFGRAGRQGDRGSVQCIVALDDALLHEFTPALAALAAASPPGPLRRAVFALARWSSQRRAERQHRASRREAVKHDDQINDLMSMAGRL